MFAQLFHHIINSQLKEVDVFFGANTAETAWIYCYMSLQHACYND